MQSDTRQSAQHFLDLIKQSHRGKFKVYIGMSAGVGKTYRMLQEAHQLSDAGVDIRIGYVETHGRQETEALVDSQLFPEGSFSIKERNLMKWIRRRSSISTRRSLL